MNRGAGGREQGEVRGSEEGYSEEEGASRISARPLSPHHTLFPAPRT